MVVVVVRAVSAGTAGWVAPVEVEENSRRQEQVGRAEE